MGGLCRLLEPVVRLAIIGNEFYQTTTNVTLAEGESVVLSGYRFTYDGLESSRQSNLTEVRTYLSISTEESGRTVGVVGPRRNIYDKTPDMPTSEVGVRMSISEDLYVVLNGWEEGGALATFSIYVNPLTVWMWIGGVVIVIGTLITTWPSPRPSPQRQGANAAIPVSA